MAVVAEGKVVLVQKMQSGAADGNQRKKDGADGEFSLADVEAQARPKLG